MKELLKWTPHSILAINKTKCKVYSEMIFGEMLLMKIKKWNDKIFGRIFNNNPPLKFDKYIPVNGSMEVTVCLQNSGRNVNLSSCTHRIILLNTRTKQSLASKSINTVYIFLNNFHWYNLLKYIY